jgi:hypothetical protein
MTTIWLSTFWRSVILMSTEERGAMFFSSRGGCNDHYQEPNVSVTLEIYLGWIVEFAENQILCWKSFSVYIFDSDSHFIGYVPRLPNFLGTTYQNGKIYQMTSKYTKLPTSKYTKLPQNTPNSQPKKTIFIHSKASKICIPNGLKISRITSKYSK